MLKRFQRLITQSEQGNKGPLSTLYVDCANGVGAPALNELSKHIGESLPLHPLNTSITTKGALNSQCGADFVKTKQALPPSVVSSGLLAKPGTKGCSFDGDADRIVYYYLQDGKTFRLLDGDKIAVMVAMFLGDLVTKAKLEGDEKLKVGMVQTAYANGSSTKYLKSVSEPLYTRAPLILLPAQHPGNVRPYWSQTPASRRATFRYRSILRSQRSWYRHLFPVSFDHTSLHSVPFTRLRQRDKTASGVCRTDQSSSGRCAI